MQINNTLHADNTYMIEARMLDVHVQRPDDQPRPGADGQLPLPQLRYAYYISN